MKLLKVLDLLRVGKLGNALDLCAVFQLLPIYKVFGRILKTLDAAGIKTTTYERLILNGSIYCYTYILHQSIVHIFAKLIKCYQC